MSKTAKNTRRKSHMRDALEGKKDKFLEYMRRGWTVAQAARNAGIVHRTVYAHRERDEEFAKEWDDALLEGTGILEAEAIRRGFHGTIKPVYQQGRRVGSIREYSDTMASLILKKRDPAFKERHEHSGTGKDGSFIVQIGERESKV